MLQLLGRENPYFPEKCLGHGCTSWAWNSALKFADCFFSCAGTNGCPRTPETLCSPECPILNVSVQEIWYVVSGDGDMWRSLDGHEQTVVLEPGVCLTIPLGTSFQFRAGREYGSDG
ncbi:hypothetical protein AB0I77_24720 [Streptomyces sp. NPDC050619]|uniref:cupin domain-containing protein n=1 Tax=Streptomyces sp. NPDC050619 TaxID=3157214 RepID=UPI00343172AE